MAGASLLPEYYKEKMNLAVFLAPPAAMMYNSVLILEVLSTRPVRDGLIAVMDLIKLWDIIPYDYLISDAAKILCN